MSKQYFSLYIIYIGIHIISLTRLIHTSVLPSNWNLRKFFALTGELGQVTSVTQKNVLSAVVYYYCAWYVYLRDRRYINDRNFFEDH